MGTSQEGPQEGWTSTNSSTQRGRSWASALGPHRGPAQATAPCPQQPHASRGTSAHSAKRTPLHPFTCDPGRTLWPGLAVGLWGQPYASDAPGSQPSKDTSFFVPSSTPGIPPQASSEHTGQGLPRTRGAGEAQGQGARRPGPDAQEPPAVTRRQAQPRRTCVGAPRPDSFLPLFIYVLRTRNTLGSGHTAVTEQTASALRWSPS